MKRQIEKEALDNAISEHVAFDCYEFSCLPKEEKRELVGLYLASKEADEAWEILTEVDERNLPLMLAECIKTNDSLAAFNILANTLEGYVKDDIQKLFDVEVAYKPSRDYEAHVDHLTKIKKEQRDTELGL